MNAEQQDQRIVAFYLGLDRDLSGRKIEDVWAFDNERLESVHDFIQWLFPSAKPSQYNLSAPLLNEPTIAAFHESSELRRRLMKSLRVMLSFYGLRLEGRTDRNPVISRAENYGDRQSNWQDAEPGHINHNLLRLTRIIEALAVLGHPPAAKALCACLEDIQPEVPEKIPARTLAFWKQAAGA